MRVVLILLILVTAGVGAYVRHHEEARAEHLSHRAVPAAAQAQPPRSLEERAASAQGTTLPVERPDPPRHSALPGSPAVARAAPYRCDGRVYCSQMHSCEEATWVQQNCPGTKMDGNHDGIPCEKQFCGH